MCGDHDRFSVMSILRNVKLFNRGVCLCLLSSELNNQFLGVVDAEQQVLVGIG